MPRAGWAPPHEPQPRPATVTELFGGGNYDNRAAMLTDLLTIPPSSMLSLMWSKTALILHGLVASNIALGKGVGKLPPIGYNGISCSFGSCFYVHSLNDCDIAWNTYQCNVDEALILQTARQMKDLGLLAAGYNWINLDDCYASKNRSASGEIVAGLVCSAGIQVFPSN